MLTCGESSLPQVKVNPNHIHTIRIYRLNRLDRQTDRLDRQTDDRWMYRNIDIATIFKKTTMGSWIETDMG